MRSGIKSTALPVIRFVDGLSEWTGRCVAWLTLALVLLTFSVVVMRYLFNVGSVALQESLLYLHSLVFLLGTAYTLKQDGHVRVDIFYRPMSAIGQAWVNLFGNLLLLLPTSIFLFWISLEYVASSWSYFEGSREAGGIDAVYLLKSLMLIAPLTLLLQGCADLLKALLLLLGLADPDATGGAAGTGDTS